jgi:hypothetical protein
MEFPKIFMFILILGVLYSLAMIAFAIWGYSISDGICKNSEIKRSLQALVVGNLIYLVCIMTFGMMCRRSCVVIFEIDDAGQQDTPTWFYSVSALIGLFNLIVSAHIYRLYKEEKCDEKDTSNFSGILINLGIVTSIIVLIYSAVNLVKRWLKEREKTAPIREAKRQSREQTKLATLLRDLNSKIATMEKRKQNLDASIATRSEQIPVKVDQLSKATDERKQAEQQIIDSGKAPDNYNAIIRAYNSANAEKTRLETAVKSETRESQKLGVDINKLRQKLNEALRKAGKEEIGVGQQADAGAVADAVDAILLEEQGN